MVLNNSSFPAIKVEHFWGKEQISLPLKRKYTAWGLLFPDYTLDDHCIVTGEGPILLTESKHERHNPYTPKEILRNR